MKLKGKGFVGALSVCVMAMVSAVTTAGEIIKVCVNSGNCNEPVSDDIIPLKQFYSSGDTKNFHFVAYDEDGNQLKSRIDGNGYADKVSGHAEEVKIKDEHKWRGLALVYMESVPTASAYSGWQIREVNYPNPSTIKIVNKNDNSERNVKKLSDFHYQIDLENYGQGFSIVDEGNNYLDDSKVLNLNKYAFLSWHASNPDHWNKNTFVTETPLQKRTDRGVVDIIWNSEKWEISMYDPGIVVRDVEGNREIPLEKVGNCVYRFDLRRTKEQVAYKEMGLNDNGKNGFTLFTKDGVLIPEDEDNATIDAMRQNGMSVVMHNAVQGIAKFNKKHGNNSYDFSNTQNYYSVYNVVRENFLYLRWNGSIWQATLENEVFAGYDEMGNPLVCDFYLTAVHKTNRRITLHNPQVSCIVDPVLQVDSTVVWEDQYNASVNNGEYFPNTGAREPYNNNIVNQYTWYKSSDNVHWEAIWPYGRTLLCGRSAFNPNEGSQSGLYYRVQFEKKPLGWDDRGKPATPESKPLYISNSVYLYSDDLYVHNFYGGEANVPKSGDPRLPQRVYCGSNDECYTFKLNLADWKYGFGLTNFADEFVRMKYDCNQNDDLGRYINVDNEWWYEVYTEAVPDALDLYINSSAPKLNGDKWEYQWKMSLENPCASVKFTIKEGDGVSCGSIVKLVAESPFSDFQWYKSTSDKTTKDWRAVPAEKGGNSKELNIGSGDDWKDYAARYYKVVSGGVESTVKFVPSTQILVTNLGGTNGYAKLDTACCDVYKIDLNQYKEGFAFNEINCERLKPEVDDDAKGLIGTTATGKNDYSVADAVKCDNTFGYVYRNSADNKWHLSADNNICGCLRATECGEIGEMIGRVCSSRKDTRLQYRIYPPKIELCDDAKGADFYVTYDVEQTINKGDYKVTTGKIEGANDTIYYVETEAKGGGSKYNTNGEINLRWTVKVYKKDCNGGADALWAQTVLDCKKELYAHLDTIASDPNHNICAGSAKTNQDIWLALHASAYSQCNGGFLDMDYYKYIKCEWFAQFVEKGDEIGDPTKNIINEIGSGVKPQDNQYADNMLYVTVNMDLDKILEQKKQGVFVIGCMQYRLDSNNNKVYLNGGKPVYTFYNVMAEPKAGATLYDSTGAVIPSVVFCKGKKANEIYLRAQDTIKHCTENAEWVSTVYDKLPKEIQEVLNYDAGTKTVSKDLQYELWYTTADADFGENGAWSVEVKRPALAPTDSLFVPGENVYTEVETEMYTTKEMASCEKGAEGATMKIVGKAEKPLCDATKPEDLGLDSIAVKLMFKGGIAPNQKISVCRSFVDLTDKIEIRDNTFTVDCNAKAIDSVFVIPINKKDTTIKTESPMSLSGECDNNPSVSVSLTNGGMVKNVEELLDLANGRGEFVLKLGETVATYSISDACNHSATCRHKFIVMNELDFDCGDASKKGVEACLDGENEIEVQLPLPIIKNGLASIDYTYDLKSTTDDSTGADLTVKVEKKGINDYVIKLKERTSVTLTWNVYATDYKDKTEKEVSCSVLFKPYSKMPNADITGNKNLCEEAAKFTASFSGANSYEWDIKWKSDGAVVSTVIGRTMTVPLMAGREEDALVIKLTVSQLMPDSKMCVVSKEHTATFFKNPKFDLVDPKSRNENCPVEGENYELSIENVDAHNDYTVTWTGATVNSADQTKAILPKSPKDCGHGYSYGVKVRDNVSECEVDTTGEFSIKASGLALKLKCDVDASGAEKCEKDTIEVVGEDCKFLVPSDLWERLKNKMDVAESCGTPKFTSNPAIGSAFEGITTLIVTAEDLCGEPVSLPFTLTEASSSLKMGTPAYDSTNVSCKGGSDGSIWINATTTAVDKTVEYALYAGENKTDKLSATAGKDSLFEGLKKGTYYADVTDNNGCHYYDTIYISEPDDALRISIDTIDFCDNKSGNAAYVGFNIKGGTPAYFDSLFGITSTGDTSLVADTVIARMMNGKYEGLFTGWNVARWNTSLYNSYKLKVADKNNCTADTLFEVKPGKVDVKLDCDKLMDQKIELDANCYVEYEIPISDIENLTSLQNCGLKGVPAVAIAYNMDGSSDFVLVENGIGPNIQLTGKNLKRPVVVKWVVFLYDKREPGIQPYVGDTAKLYSVKDSQGNEIGGGVTSWYMSECEQRFYAKDNGDTLTLVDADKVPSETINYSDNSDLCSATFEKDAIYIKTKLGISRCTEVQYIVRDTAGNIVQLETGRDTLQLEGTVTIPGMVRGEHTIEYLIDNGDDASGKMDTVKRTQVVEVVDDVAPTPYCPGKIELPMDPNLCESDTVITFSDYAKKYLVENGRIEIEKVGKKEIIKDKDGYTGKMVYKTDATKEHITMFSDECGDTLKLSYKVKGEATKTELLPDDYGIEIRLPMNGKDSTQITWTLTDPSGQKFECASDVVMVDTTVPLANAETILYRNPKTDINVMSCAVAYELERDMYDIENDDFRRYLHLSTCTNYTIRYSSIYGPNKKTNVPYVKGKVLQTYSDTIGDNIDVITFKFVDKKDAKKVYTTRVNISVKDDLAPDYICPDRVPVYLDENCSYDMKLSPNRVIADLRADLVLGGNESYLGFDWEKNWNDVNDDDKHAIKYDCDSLKVHVVENGSEKIFDAPDTKSLSFVMDTEHTFTFRLSDVSNNKTEQCTVTYFAKDTLAPSNVKSKLDDEILYYKDGNCYGDTTLELKTVFKALKLDTTKLFDNCDGDDVTIHYTVKKNGADSISTVTELKTGSPLYLRGVDSDVFDVLWRVRDKSNNDAKVPQKYIVRDNIAPDIDCGTAFKPVNLVLQRPTDVANLEALINAGLNYNFTYYDECDDTTFTAASAFDSTKVNLRTDILKADTTYIIDVKFVDKHGNATVCPQQITVTNNKKADIRCPEPPAQPYACDNNLPAIPRNLEEFKELGGRIYDGQNLLDAITVKDSTDKDKNNLCTGKVIYRTFTFQYVFGDTSQCTTTYSAKDTLPPTWGTLPNMESEIACDAYNPNADKKIQLPNAYDNCGAVAVSIVDSTDNKGSDPTKCDYYSFDVKYAIVARDGCGNADSVYFTLKVRDNKKPSYKLNGFDSDTFKVYSDIDKPCRFLMPSLAKFVTDMSDNCADNVWIEQSPSAGVELFEDVNAVLIIKDGCNGDTINKNITVFKSSNVVDLVGNDYVVCSDTFGKGLDSRLIASATGTTQFLWHGELVFRNSLFCYDIYKGAVDASHILYSTNPYTFGDKFVDIKSDAAARRKLLAIDNPTVNGDYYYVAMDTVSQCTDTVKVYVAFHEKPRIAMSSDTVEACEFQSLPVYGASGDYSSKYNVCVGDMGTPIIHEGWLLDGEEYDGITPITFDYNQSSLVYFAENECGRTRSDSSKVWDCAYSYEDYYGEFVSDLTTESMIKDSSSSSLAVHVHQQLNSDGMLLTAPFEGKARVWTGDPVELELITHYDDGLEFLWYKVVGAPDALYHKFDAYGNVIEEYMDPSDNVDEKFAVTSVSDSYSKRVTVDVLTDTTQFYVVVTDNICSSAASNIVKIDVCKEIPTAITPYNSVGLNDVFMEGFTVQIFDRYGHLLFQGDNGWDGFINGAVADPTVYFYTVTMRDGSLAKGSVEVVYFK